MVNHLCLELCVYRTDFAEKKISCVARASLPIDGHSELFQFQEISEAVVHKVVTRSQGN